MNDTIQIAGSKNRKRCAVYCRVSSDERLDQEFNSIDAQKEAGHAYIASQRAEGWIPVADDYDDPGYSGGNTDRPALKRLLADAMLDASALRELLTKNVWPAPSVQGSVLF